MIVLAGDVGGTNCRLALVEVGSGSARIVEDSTVPSRSVPSLAAEVNRFLDGKSRPERACFGVAGPVVGGTVRTTNLPWFVETAALARDIRIPSTTLINDFAALGAGLAFLTPADLVPLQAGEAEPGGPLALIGAGTGLGQGFLTRSSGGYEMHPSEGGHSSFAPSTPREWRLRECLEKRYGPVSWERVVSGPGLAAVYACLTGAPSPLSPPEISERGMSGTDPAAAETLDVFAAAFGAQAGNLALTVLATGGVYVAGGIAPHIMPKLQDGTFIRAFRSKGELEPLLRRIPVQVITSSHAGLLGAAAVAAPPRTGSPAGGNA